MSTASPKIVADKDARNLPTTAGLSSNNKILVTFIVYKPIQTLCTRLVWYVWLTGPQIGTESFPLIVFL